MSAPRPDGLRLRQTPDARVIQVRPYQARPTALACIVASGIGLLAWAPLRAMAGPDTGVAWSVAVLLYLAAVVAAWFVGRRRAEQLLEVYVGDHHLELVWSHHGRERRRERIDLTTVSDTSPSVGRVHIHSPTGDWWLPMETHTAEAVDWMVEHLREAGRGARKRA